MKMILCASLKVFTFAAQQLVFWCSGSLLCNLFVLTVGERERRMEVFCWRMYF